MIAAGCLTIFIGISCAPHMPAGLFATVTWLLTGTALFVFAIARQKAWALIFALVGGLIIGSWRGSSQVADMTVYSQLYGATTRVSGVVSDDVDVNARGQQVLRVRDVSVKGHDLPGMMWVTLATKRSVQRSDHIIIEGKVTKGFGTFAASVYAGKLIVLAHPVPPDAGLALRNWFASGVTKATNEPQTSLGLGYLLGQRRGLPPELEFALKAAGLTHIVVASGYNLMILVRLARRLFEKISKYLAFLAASSMIVGFIAITGMSPSMARAGLVAGLSLVAWYYGRRIHPFVLLPLAMAITTFINPSYAWGDLGWQLSFAAFAGVMIVAPIANVYFLGDKPERPVVRILIETISAQVCTLPVILYAFGQFSVVAPIANLLILPLVPIAMLLTFVAGIGGLMIPIFAHVVGLPAELLLSYMTQTIEYVGKLPWATTHIPLTAWGVVGMYAVIATVSLYMWHRTRLDLSETSVVE